MRQLRYLLLVLAAIALHSCDPVYSSEIRNETRDSIIIEVNFDREKMNKIWGGMPIIPYLRGYGYFRGVRVIEFDTINFKKTYQLNANNTFWVENGMKRPDYEIFKSIKIISKSDTLILNGQKQIKEAFRQSKKREWVLEIKN